MNFLKKYKLDVLVFFFLSSVFLILAYKDVFSERTLVPNIEPYPDTFYYSNPAWNLALGNGYVMKAFDYESKIVTPPLYSLFLTPFYMLKLDVRMFYFANILLGLGSVGIFICTIRKLTSAVKSGILITFFLGFFYVTNYYVYTIPSLLMAENITYFFSLLAVWLLIVDFNKKNLVLSGFIPLVFMLIKFSNLPLAASFAFLYSLKVIVSKLNLNYKLLYFTTLFSGGALFAVYILMSDILVGHKNLEQGASFGLQFFQKNFRQYLDYLLANRINYIWYHHNMISSLFILPVIMGIVLGFVHKKSKAVIVELLLYGGSVLVFMSFFYFVDARYIFMVYPILLILSVYFFIEIRTRFNIEILLVVMILMGLTYLLVPRFGLVENERYIISLKKQIGINFKHAETPWHYIALKQINEYLKETDPKTTYVATFMAPYFVHYYANGHYQYLPITTLFEFYEDKKNAHGSYYQSLAAHYAYLLKKGNRIYITPYWENNIREWWPKDYQNLTSHFTLVLVKEGCLGACNLYEVKLKEL